MRHAWRGAIDAVRDVLFPRGCAGCDMPDAVLCEDCLDMFSGCRERILGGEPMVRVWSAAIYQGLVRHAVLGWKDHDDVELDAPLMHVVVEVTKHGLLPYLDREADVYTGNGVVAVIPVPSSPASIRRRGRYHTLPLAYAVASALRSDGINARVSRALVHTAGGRKSVQQISPTQRMQRISGRIVVDACDEAYGACDKVVLVDDIVTTGATLKECTYALRRQGVNVLGAVVLADAVVPRYDDDCNG
ncbi:phosphoribosyl transferase [Bifidobacterium sp. DSM 109959]|uniref:Phosphoribosyl transferase n=2 Tax=Bifidobacterium olomucense TaxID=2675324 RepID=A0A7Y0HX19_9BIFI|nr:phosphoribosyl transferase [Bifidobacterium sp. DSM 109959]